jgi:hypothetical protein
MRDIEIISKALLDANAEIARHRVWLPIEADETVKRLNRILNHPRYRSCPGSQGAGFRPTESDKLSRE